MARGIIIKAGDIFRDIGAMVTALDVRGGGGSPKELRSDAGIFVQYGIEETLKRHPELIEVDVSVNQLSPGAADTTQNTAFSFPEDHYILGFSFQSSSAANMLWGVLEAVPQGQADRVTLGFTLLADRQTFVGLPGDDDVFPPTVLCALPLFGRAQTDYNLTTRSSAGGASNLAVHIYRVQAPQGVEIAH